MKTTLTPASWAAATRAGSSQPARQTVASLCQGRAAHTEASASSRKANTSKAAAREVQRSTERSNASRGDMIIYFCNRFACITRS